MKAVRVVELRCEGSYCETHKCEGSFREVLAQDIVGYYSVLGKKKPNTEFHIKTVVFDLQMFTWLESYYKVDLFSVVIRHDRYLY